MKLRISYVSHPFPADFMFKLTDDEKQRVVANCDHLKNPKFSRTNSIKGTLNKFKIINQSTKPKAIQASLNTLSQISRFFINLLPAIEALNLTPQSCEYYATWFKKAKLSQLKQFTDQNKIYLHLIAFIQHQFYLRQDKCVGIF
ncbi:MAG: hypothetical protein KIT56_09075 [Gammaproteobacteria bacterium]|nr:hypothetical protein [Gammaproteobacteria bacterium]MCW5584007.1 hypothetical protein [Gammaproteobacteria bacterium]